MVVLAVEGVSPVALALRVQDSDSLSSVRSRIAKELSIQGSDAEDWVIRYHWQSLLYALEEDEHWSIFQDRVQYSNTKEIRASVSVPAVLRAQQGASLDGPLACAALSQIPLIPSPAPAETFREQDMPRPAQPEQPVTVSQLMELISGASTKMSIEIAKTSIEEIRDKLDKLDAVMRESRLLRQAMSQAIGVILLQSVRPSSGKTGRRDNRPFKLSLYNYYQQMGPPVAIFPAHLKCMLTGITMSSEAIVASHLLPYKNKHLSGLFELPNIDDPCNGLLLFKGIKEAYDRCHICFVYDSESSHFVCKVLNKTVSQKTWKQYVSDNGSKAKAKGTDISIVQQQYPVLQEHSINCLQDLEGKRLVLPPLISPMKRILNFHARMALYYARSDGVLDDPDWDFEDFASEGECAASMMFGR